MVDLISKYQSFIEESIKDYSLPTEPAQLYQPISYFLTLGGKRMRPILALMACELFDEDFRSAKNAAMAVELFHNFSLIHDDIMDEAPLRRGRTTVHEKWNANVAILSGDALLIEAYKVIATYPPSICHRLLKIFNQTATAVCEGQQWDMDFELQAEVSIENYLKMIAYKTAVLLGCSLKMGAIVAGASEDDASKLYEFGVNLGVAFQIQDDILDVYADKDKFGKQVGGDILANKKTLLWLTALKDSDAQQLNKFKQLMSESNPETKVAGVTAIYNSLSIHEKARTTMELYHQKAIDNLNQIDCSEERKAPLLALAEFLLARDF